MIDSILRRSGVRPMLRIVYVVLVLNRIHEFLISDFRL